MTSKSQRNEDSGQEREQEVRKDTAKKRDRIKVRESSSNPLVCGRSFGKEGEVFDTSQLDEKITGVEADLEGLDEVKSNLVELEEVNKEGLTNLELKLTEALSSLHREFETLKRQVDETDGAGVADLVTIRETCIEAPKPKEFRGERNAQDFNKELKRQFYPQNVVHEDRRKLREFKKTSSIRDYVKEFTKLTLQIPSLTSEDLVFYFLDGVQNWAKQELQVDEAIVVAESLTDFQADAAKGRDNRSKMFLRRWITTETKASMFQTKAAIREDRKKGVPHHEGYYICGETSHAARYCSSLSKLNAMIAAQKEQEQAAIQIGGPSGEQGGQAGAADKGKNVVVGMFNHMALFNHMTFAELVAQPTSVRPRESLFVNAKLNGKDVRIMVDTGATHNFVTKERAKDLCLNYVTNNMMLKTINSLTTTVHGFTLKVLIDLG
ncbi:hypothetical protein KY289_037947 [Solanum tuberosum]|nr:hypothetical protein KY289_037947 [Solanum tuberosum]